MQLILQQLLPIPLRDRLETRSSDVWLSTLYLGGAERIFIQAPSGTGKTTLMHLLYGLRDDYEGQIRWNDAAVNTPEQKAKLRSHEVSIVFQDLRLFPQLTAWENLEIKRLLTDTVSGETVSGWMERLGIAHKRNALAKTLSYGEQQRLAIIRSLMQPFQWLLMDEPFSHLDRANIAKAAALIDEVVSGRKASFLLADLDENDYLPYTKTLRL